jgi:ribosomal protein L36
VPIKESKVAEKQKRKTRLFQRTQIIHILNDENPRRKGTQRYDIFEALRNNMTVDEFLDKVIPLRGGTKDLEILVKSGHVQIVNPPPSTSGANWQ